MDIKKSSVTLLSTPKQPRDTTEAGNILNTEKEEEEEEEEEELCVTCVHICNQNQHFTQR